VDNERRSMESRVARLEQQVETHEGDIRRLMPMSVQVGQMEVRIEQMQHSLGSAVEEIKKFRIDQDAREDDQRRERKKDRWAFVTAMLMTGTLVVGAIALLVPS
jgi:uncharacterized coiled-coil protein SlyX